MTTVTRPVHFVIKHRRKRIVDEPPVPSSGPAGRVPRVARLMALAIKFDRLLRDGVVDSQSELARLAHVTQPRMTQIMNLLHLAPDIQEEILFLPEVAEGRDPIHERSVRHVTRLITWREQRQSWKLLRSR